MYIYQKEHPWRMARLSSLSGHREAHSIGSSSGSAFFNLSQWHLPVPQPGQHDLWPLRHLQPSLWGNRISLMGTKTSLEMKAQSSMIQISHNNHYLSAATIWQVYLYSSKIFVMRVQEHKIHLRVINIIKWERLFFPYYKCLYTKRPRGKTHSNLGFPFPIKCLAQPFGCCEINSWEVPGSGPITLLPGFNTVHTRAVNKLGRLRSTCAA